MHTSRTLILALTILALSVVALFIPIPVLKQREQMPTAKAATISLVERVATLPSSPHPETLVEPEAKQKPTDRVAAPSADASPSPIQEQTAPSPEIPKAVPAAAIPAEIPVETLIDGYYPIESVTKAPVFDRSSLAKRIVYPPLAKRQHKQGLVMLKLFISATGLVERVVVEDDPGYDMGEAAVTAFLNFQTEPATKEGKAVAVTLRYPVRFTLQ